MAIAIHLKQAIWKTARSLKIALLLPVCSMISFLTLKNPMETLYDLFVNVTFMGTKTACEGFWNV